MGKRVLVAMSGGVDSAVAAALLGSRVTTLLASHYDFIRNQMNWRFDPDVLVVVLRISVMLSQPLLLSGFHTTPSIWRRNLKRMC